ncbi:hypothetical protein M2171_001215 [Bradyrhizobium japonicum USDA 38]|nr:hypothetical protein [Bradyrhizobium japonicum USDA 38]MCS3944596.1 hypothetical protein [Bradyrhizobium japonicum]
MQSPGGTLGSALLGVLENVQVPNSTVVTKRPVSPMLFAQMKPAGRSGVFPSLANQGKWLKHAEPSHRLRALHPAT